MKIKRIISLLLAALMMVGAFTMIAAAEDEAPEYTFETSPTKKAYDYISSKEITSAAKKLEKMDLRLVQNGFKLYVDEYSGEVAVQSVATGETLFTNPYDVGSVNTTVVEKAKLISQLAISFSDPSVGSVMTYYSANKGVLTNKTDNAAMGNDLNVSYIKDGIRVEYSIGTEEARMLLPVWLKREAFEDLCATMDENGFTTVSARGAKEYFSAFYFLRDPATGGNDAMYNNFPITKEGVAIYTLTNTSTRNKRLLEGYVKTYAPDYTYEDMDAQHAEVKYEDDEIAPPLFKLALEYTLDEQGLSVRLPANGIRFDETYYQLESIDMLPFMGAGSSANEGYTFFPDGSGALFDFQECKTFGKTVQVTGKIYGQDYAYHTISGTNQQVIRYPVYGLVETQSFAVLEDGTVSDANRVSEEDQAKIVDTFTKDRGYVAIIEEGASLVSLMLQHERTSGKNTVKAMVTPRPKDSYNLGDSVSIAANASYSVVSNRKYTGTYRIRYIMLTDADVAAENDIDGTYPCSYYGMADAYRNYLEDKKVLTPLTEESLSDAEKLPLYIEALGSLETTERILSIPVEVMTPLTTFADIKSIYDDLAEEGIDNINFILNGFTKGGLTAPATPYRLKWEKAAEEGGVKFNELLEYAKEEGFGLYPDVDFVFIHSNKLFDGLSLTKHAAKTIDNRYASLQQYDATRQTYISYYDLLFSAAYMSKFYEKFTESYLKEDPMGISVSTLGSYVSSDFDEDEAYNRDDAESYTKLAFEYFDERFGKVMTSGGNAYSWKYVDYITDIATDSSRYSRSSASVPFLGIVLHGYVEIAGTPINMEGNLDYAMLKAIESGSALKFIVAYRNSNNLKDDFILNKYYSIDYNIWQPDIISLYNEISDALSDVQTSKIVRHEFIQNATRVPDADELERDAQAAINAMIEAEKLANIAATESERKAILNARKDIVKYSSLIEDGTLGEMLSTEFMTKYTELRNTYNTAYDTLETLIGEALEAAWNEAKTALDAFGATPDETNEDYIAAKEAFDQATEDRDLVDDWKAYNAALEALDANEETDTESEEYKAAKKKLTDATNKIKDIINENKEISTEHKAAKETRSKALEDINALIGEDAYGFYDEYISLLDGINACYAKIEDYKAVITASDLNDAYKQELLDKADVIVAATALFVGVKDTKLAEIATLYATAKADFGEDFTVEEYKYELVEELPEEAPVASDDRYVADKNKVVYEEFENGKAFLLNFNNYKVIVTLDGVTYTLDAYGYLIVSEAE